MGEYDNKELILDSGISLTYHEEGESNNLLLLLHGLNGHSGTWRNNISHLASEKRKVVAPSLPPWPTSRQPEISGYVKQVLEFIGKLAPSTVSIAGNSMGGWIAMKLAERVGTQTVKAIVLEDSAGTRNPRDEGAIDRLDTLEVPVLIIWGRNDRIIPSEDAEYLHSKIRNSIVRIFPDSGHVPHWEEPEEYNGLVTEFLQGNRV